MLNRIAENRIIKSLMRVRDATCKTVNIVPERAIGGEIPIRIVDRFALLRGHPKSIQTNNDKESSGKAIPELEHRRYTKLIGIDPSKPNQSAFIESFIGRFREEGLHENCFTNLIHTSVFIETWQREYNQEYEMNSFYRLTPIAYA